MSLIGGLVGGMIGFTFLGPLGALIGSVVGSRMGRNSVRRKNPNNFDHQVAFFAALFACLAKIAKADGQVTKEEINKIEDFITQKFNLDGEQRNFAINIFFLVMKNFTIIIFFDLWKITDLVSGLSDIRDTHSDIEGTPLLPFFIRTGIAVGKGIQSSCPRPSLSADRVSV